MNPSRRSFLQQTSAMAAAGLLSRVPLRALWSQTPNGLLPPPDEPLLRELALKAVDAARAAGASFADVRVSVARAVSVFADYGGTVPYMAPPSLSSRVGCGVRAVVDGAWGFMGSYDLTPDGVTRVAQAAVTRARANRPRHPRTLELAPAPRVNEGNWATPIEQDAFNISIREQGDLQLAALAQAAQVPEIQLAGCAFYWGRSHRVFASTEGSLIVQRLDQAYPRAWVSVWGPGGDEAYLATERVETFRIGGYGYEAVAGANLVVELRQAAERALARARPPVAPIPAEVGRYDLVCSREAVAHLLASTVAQALNLERALGYLANTEGTSFAAPPDVILGTYRVGSPLLTVRGDRSRPHAPGTVGWDEEGVKPDEYTFIQEGVVVDYHTNRQTAVALADWYRQRGETVRSHGCAGNSGQTLPKLQLPNLTMQPGRSEVSVEDLIAGTKRGFYLRGRPFGDSDQQLLNTQYAGRRVQEIRDGKLGRPVKDLAFQFITPQFWKNLDGLGGAASGGLSFADAMPWRKGEDADPLAFLDQIANVGVWAVPARFREVNVLNVGRIA